MLWGLLAISAPILIHFWNQKKAILVNWAAMKWLIESQKLKAKGFRFEDLLLLLLRILAFTLIVFILAKPLVKHFFTNNKILPKKVHVFEKSKKVIDNYKFEIEQALSKNEKVLFANQNLEIINIFPTEVQEKDAQLVDFQSILNKISQIYFNNEIHYFLSNETILQDYPNYFLDQNFQIHLVNNKRLSLSNALNNGQYIYVNETLTHSEIAPKNRKIIDKRNIIVSIDPNEKTLKAAFEAIAEVYGFNFNFINKNKTADIAIGDLKKNDKSDLRIQTGVEKLPGKYYEINENLESKASSSIYQATLPEQILEIVLKHYGLENFQTERSKKQLNSIFQKTDNKIENAKTRIDKYLIILLLTTIIAERWISLKNNK